MSTPYDIQFFHNKMYNLKFQENHVIKFTIERSKIFFDIYAIFSKCNVYIKVQMYHHIT